MSSDSSATSDVKVVNKALQGVKSTLLSTVSSADSAIRRLDYDKDLLGGVRRDHKYDLSAKLEGTKRKLNQLRRMGVVEKYSGYLSLLFFHGVVIYIISKRLRLLLLLSSLWSTTKHVWVFPGKSTHVTTLQAANETAEIAKPSLVSTESSIVYKIPSTIVDKRVSLEDRLQTEVELNGFSKGTISSDSDLSSCHMERGRCISLLYRAYVGSSDSDQNVCNVLKM